LILSVAIPCYNEARNIPLILTRCKEVIRRDDVEIILVDNGSTDDSPAVLGAMLPSCPFARSIRVDRNLGYGFGILAGLRSARGEYIGWTHADMQTDPGDCMRGLEMLLRRQDPENVFLKGSRKGRPALDECFTIGMSLFESAYLGTPLWDINAQPNIFHRSFFLKWRNPPHDFSLDLYALLMAKRTGVEVVRIEVRFPPRLHGQSNWNTSLASKWKFIRRTLSFSRSLKKELPR